MSMSGVGGDLVIWDNYAIQHSRTREADPSEGRRLLQRVSFGKYSFVEQLEELLAPLRHEARSAAPLPPPAGRKLRPLHALLALAASVAIAFTIRAWSDAGDSLRETASALHIHPNTVTQRLDRVGQLLGDGWRDPRRKLDLQLALQLARLRPDV